MGKRNPRVELIVVAGGTTPVGRAGVERVLTHALASSPCTAVVHHDLRGLPRGVVHRRVRTGVADDTTVLEPVDGLLPDVLREDIRGLSARADIARIVLHLDPVLEPEQVCHAIAHVETGGAVVTDAVDLLGVVTVLDAGSWFADATCAEVTADGVTDRDLADLGDEERTIAQLVVAQAEFADLIVLAGTAEPWELARLDAVLDRLAPLATRLPLAALDDRVLLAELPVGARRGVPESPHAPLLRGQPPLQPVGGIVLLTFTARRPFHPGRLHHAIDVLLSGVVRTRGRVWLATRPEATLWLESAGGGLEIGYAGEWLAEHDPQAWALADPERAAAAALRWHPLWGERAQELTVLLHDADPDHIEATLRAALLTPGELAGGEAAWRAYPDPFGWWHTDPCDDTEQHLSVAHAREDER